MPALWFPTIEEMDAARLRHEARRWALDVLVSPVDPTSVIVSPVDHVGVVVSVCSEN